MLQLCSITLLIILYQIRFWCDIPGLQFLKLRISTNKIQFHKSLVIRKNRADSRQHGGARRGRQTGWPLVSH